MLMNKNNLILSSIKAKMQAGRPPLDPAGAIVTASPADRTQGSVSTTPEKEESAEPSTVFDIEGALKRGGFGLLAKELEAAREILEFDRKIVYIDDDTAEVLDLLRKKAKVKSNLLVSALLHEFFSKYKDLIQELKEKRSNKLLD